MSLTTNCAGVTHVWADGEMCQCGEYSMRDWHKPECSAEDERDVE